ncbi:type I-D CRISPR-associated protein Cas5/Csc1 [Candidatus Poribacteria bacterium]|nr:type I-D CRISPR-associated protein Cas5/Csc1 [Candidatus Poribacteria bacterium]MYH80307.1 type I-D CRISPR-associated protein Cas5/Csc1 [Candidatus Poribacteria bacterium]MYK96313.1 type I-D CRISPR-associated protein Cas5/Csc1 [Candidatus Poribacteria bacterium]
MQVTKCRLTLHDSLYYATREMGRLYETERVIHNWALTYALGLIQKPYRSFDSVPTYQEDLTEINKAGVYVTPAKPVRYDYVISTFKFADNRHRPFSTVSNTRKKELGITVTNKPSFGKAKELAPESVFEFFIGGELSDQLPKWIRLGLWMSKARVEVEAVEPHLRPKRGVFTCKHLLNPIDLSVSPELYDLISMPPVSLLQNARFNGEYVEFGDVCLPTSMAYFAGAT